MADKPAFQNHHIIEKQAFRGSELLQSLKFDIESPQNRINLPVDKELADKLGVSRHPGGPLGGYSDGLAEKLIRLENSADGQAAMAGDKAAAKRIVSQLDDLQATMRDSASCFSCSPRIA